jgi:hypothetical protein
VQINIYISISCSEVAPIIIGGYQNRQQDCRQRSEDECEMNHFLKKNLVKL